MTFVPHKIILKDPFIKHYAGTVFDLGPPDGLSDWDDDERNREKISFSDKRTYFLPDSGNGRPSMLPVYNTLPCPENIFENIDVRSGPCRITSVCVTDGQNCDKPTDDYAIPNGAAPFLLHNDQKGHKHMILVVLAKESDVLTLQVKDLFTEGRVLNERIDRETNEVNLFNLLPGFYEISLFDGLKLTARARCIKLFPLSANVIQNKISGYFPTVW